MVEREPEQLEAVSSDTPAADASRLPIHRRGRSKQWILLIGGAVLVFVLIGVAGTLGLFRTTAKKPVVLMETSMGNIKIELYPARAPVTVRNFLNYVNSGFYEGTLFHRVLPDLIQGGGMEPGMREKMGGEPIKNEAANGLKNKRGSIAMARNSGADSATSQFFINLADNGRLDRDQAKDGIGYCVFGKVIEGMDVVEKIASVNTQTIIPNMNVPVTDVIIKSVRVIENVPAPEK